jgi:hypothetical protein
MDSIKLVVTVVRFVGMGSADHPLWRKGLYTYGVGLASRITGWSQIFHAVN